jgi:hypothetical protein
MNLSNIELPSNRKFGFFFSVIFFVTFCYFYIQGNATTAYIFAFLTVLFLVITTFKAHILSPLNRLWMRLGLLLGIIISPIVLGAIFFIMFTPLALLMRLAGRDELRLSFSQQASHWIKRDTSPQADSFKQQF